MRSPSVLSTFQFSRVVAWSHSCRVVYYAAHQFFGYGEVMIGEERFGDFHPQLKYVARESRLFSSWRFFPAHLAQVSSKSCGDASVRQNVEEKVDC